MIMVLLKRKSSKPMRAKYLPTSTFLGEILWKQMAVGQGGTSAAGQAGSKDELQAQCSRTFLRS